MKALKDWLWLLLANNEGQTGQGSILVIKVAYKKRAQRAYDSDTICVNNSDIIFIFFWLRNYIIYRTYNYKE